MSKFVIKPLNVDTVDLDPILIKLFRNCTSVFVESLPRELGL